MIGQCLCCWNLMVFVLRMSARLGRLLDCRHLGMMIVGAATSVTMQGHSP